MNGIASSTTVEIVRHPETPCSMISLFDIGKSKMYKSSLLVQTRIHKIDIFDNSIINLNARELFDQEYSRISSSMMTSTVSLFVTSTSLNCLGTLIIHLSRIFMSKIIWILPCFHIHAHLESNVFHLAL